MIIIKVRMLISLALVTFNIIFGESLSLTEKNTCIPSSAGNSSIDDVPSIREALSECGNGGTIVIPAGKTFMIRSVLDFSNCSACNFQIEGTLKVSNDLDYWEDKTNFFLIKDVAGMVIHSLTGAGLIDGNGQAYWDYFVHHRTYRRPFLVYMSNVSNVTLVNIQVKNAPCFFIVVTDYSTHVKLSNLTLSAISTSENKPLNTDGFDVGPCSYVTLENIHVTNGDDCIAFKSGADYISVTNVTCIGSHGLSIGSLGSTAGRIDTVKNVYVSNAKMFNCSKAAGIKLYPGGSSHGKVIVSNITYENILVDNCDYGFQVQNCYSSNKTVCDQSPSAAVLSDIKLIDIIGRTSKTFDPHVANIDCPAAGTCELTFSGWNVIAPSKNATVLCANYDHPSGVQCTPGAFG